MFENDTPDRTNENLGFAEADICIFEETLQVENQEQGQIGPIQQVVQNNIVIEQSTLSETKASEDSPRRRRFILGLEIMSIVEAVIIIALTAYSTVKDGKETPILSFCVYSLLL